MLERDPLTAVVEAYQLYSTLRSRGWISPWLSSLWPTLESFIEAGWQRDDRDPAVVRLDARDLYIDLAERSFGSWSSQISIQAHKLPAQETDVSHNLFAAVVEFHKKFGLEYNGPPRELPPDLIVFRTEFMVEELVEYKEALSIGDRAKQLDALVDLVYVVLGTAHLQGFDFNEAFRRVHTTNMLKVRAQKEEDSKRGSVYDVVKPEGWQAPDLSDLVRGDKP